MAVADPADEHLARSLTRPDIDIRKAIARPEAPIPDASHAMRGCVRPAEALFGPSAQLQAAKGEALIELDKPAAALGAFVAGLHAERNDPGLLAGLAQLLRALWNLNGGLALCAR